MFGVDNQDGIAISKFKSLFMFLPPKLLNFTSSNQQLKFFLIQFKDF